MKSGAYVKSDRPQGDAPNKSSGIVDHSCAQLKSYFAMLCHRRSASNPPLRKTPARACRAQSSATAESPLRPQPVRRRYRASACRSHAARIPDAQTGPICFRCAHCRRQRPTIRFVTSITHPRPRVSKMIDVVALGDDAASQSILAHRHSHFVNRQRCPRVLPVSSVRHPTPTHQTLLTIFSNSRNSGASARFSHSNITISVETICTLLIRRRSIAAV